MVETLVASLVAQRAGHLAAKWAAQKAALSAAYWVAPKGGSTAALRAGLTVAHLAGQ